MPLTKRFITVGRCADRRAPHRRRRGSTRPGRASSTPAWGSRSSGFESRTSRPATSSIVYSLLAAISRRRSSSHSGEAEPTPGQASRPRARRSGLTWRSRRRRATAPTGTTVAAMPARSPSPARRARGADAQDPRPAPRPRASSRGRVARCQDTPSQTSPGPAAARPPAPRMQRRGRQEWATRSPADQPTRSRTGPDHGRARHARPPGQRYGAERDENQGGRPPRARSRHGPPARAGRARPRARAGCAWRTRATTPRHAQPGRAGGRPTGPHPSASPSTSARAARREQAVSARRKSRSSASPQRCRSRRPGTRGASRASRRPSCCRRDTGRCRSTTHGMLHASGPTPQRERQQRRQRGLRRPAAEAHAERAEGRDDQRHLGGLQQRGLSGSKSITMRPSAADVEQPRDRGRRPRATAAAAATDSSIAAVRVAAPVGSARVQLAGVVAMHAGGVEEADEERLDAELPNACPCSIQTAACPRRAPPERVDGAQAGRAGTPGGERSAAPRCGPARHDARAAWRSAARSSTTAVAVMPPPRSAPPSRAASGSRPRASARPARRRRAVADVAVGAVARAPRDRRARACARPPSTRARARAR